MKMAFIYITKVVIKDMEFNGESFISFNTRIGRAISQSQYILILLLKRIDLIIIYSTLGMRRSNVSRKVILLK